MCVENGLVRENNFSEDNCHVQWAVLAWMLQSSPVGDYRKARCVAHVAVCMHIVSISCAHHHAPYSLKYLTDGLHPKQIFSRCAEMLPECTQCHLVMCSTYLVNVHSWNSCNMNQFEYLSKHPPKVSLTIRHRLWFHIAQHALCLFLHRCHDWMTPLSCSPNFLQWSALEFFFTDSVYDGEVWRTKDKMAF